MRTAALCPMFIVSLFVTCTAGCATARIDPGLYEQKTFAIASIHARRQIDFSNLPVAPMLFDNELGLEVLEMELGETEARLGEILGGDVVPAGKALQQKKAYDELPEAWPPDNWTQTNDMTAVDVDNAGTPAALAMLARAMGVDAVVVIRHEWALAKDRFEVGEGVMAYDRCSLLVVDKDGRRLWDDVVIARAPVIQLMSGAYSAGFNGGTWADEARQNARRTARLALDELAKRYSNAKKRASS